MQTTCRYPAGPAACEGCRSEWQPLPRSSSNMSEHNPLKSRQLFLPVQPAHLTAFFMYFHHFFLGFNHSFMPPWQFARSLFARCPKLSALLFRSSSELIYLIRVLSWFGCNCGWQTAILHVGRFHDFIKRLRQSNPKHLFCLNRYGGQEKSN